MKNLDELGFGPPNLNLPTGTCRNGHPWATNTLVHISDKRGAVRTCLTCRDESTRRRAERRGAKRTKIQGTERKNFLEKSRKAKK